jgi:hypothetical protein
MRNSVAKNRSVWNAMGENCLWNYLGHIRQNRDSTSVLRSSLIVCALTYGLADWRDTIVWLEELWDEAKQMGIDPRPHFDEIAAMSDTKNLHGISRMSTNGLFNNAIHNRTHAEEVGRLIDTIRRWDRIDSSDEVVSFCDQLLAVYQSAYAENRSLMRGSVAKNRAIWNVLGDDCLSHYLEHVRQNRDATAFLRSSLLVCSLTCGLADWRDTIVWLVQLWDDAKQLGIDPRPHFDDIAAMSETKNCHGFSGMSTNGLFINAINVRTHDAERRSHAARLVERHTPRRPWWKFWDWHGRSFDLRR